MKTTLKSLLVYGIAATLLTFSSCQKDSKLNPNTTPLSVPDASSLGISNYTTATPGFKVIGYLPSYAGDVNAVQYSKLSHINYAFADENSSGGISVESPSKLTSLVTAAHNNGVKVSLSIGGWNGGNDSGFENLAANSGTRTTFINNCMSLVSQYNLDGIDIDWEYPDNGNSSTNYSILMSALSTALHNQGKLLTAAVISSGGSSINSNVFGYVDWINIMAYDDDGANHSPYSLAQSSISYWEGRGLSHAKTILGVPFYGRNASGDEKNYNDILAGGGSANSDSWNGWGYNGIPTMQAKTNLAISSAGGVMIWDLSADGTGSNSLLSAIYTLVSGGGTTPPTSTAPIGHVVKFKGFNGKYVSGTNGVGAMTCTTTTDGDTEHFTVLDAGNGQIYLRSKAKYVSSENGTQAMTCNRTSGSGWEAFTWGVNADGTVTLKAAVNSKYVSSENGTQPITCTRATASGWESFTVTVVQ